MMTTTMMMMNKNTIVCIVALFLNYLTNSTTSGQTTLVIDPWTTRSSNQPYDNENLRVGDTIIFFWNDPEVHNVFIHPTGVCFNQTGRIPVGNQSPAVYTFQQEDGSPDGNTMLFTCDVDDHCEDFGMRIRITGKLFLLPFSCLLFHSTMPANDVSISYLSILTFLATQ
jgi:plastocyanin